MNIETIGVVGAGQMGSGIAQVAASAGFNCLICDNKEEALLKSQKTIDLSWEKLKSKGLINDVTARKKLLSWHKDLKALSSCDLVIEAIVEQEGAKKELLSMLDEILIKKDAILASNTSSISITRLASSTKRPEQFIGMHFMNPVPLMKLVELIRGARTSENTLKIIEAVVARLGKISTVALDFPGFICNRILMPMINEAFFALMEGVGNAKDIDLSMKLGCNFPMGPLELADFIGLDTCLYITEVLHKGLGEDKYRPCPLLRNYVEAGKLGRKSGEGVFKYAT
ncbi:MAG TPA: 3-hydroxyacyl-CoA dehydrogenase NAD-binding domain-containing protein [Myxococcota bacterium]|nr:3-hydroxyacyl-CoA dehydrogenase NAD-binding domain-containing protein [Myxococcota bacterium]